MISKERLMDIIFRALIQYGEDIEGAFDNQCVNLPEGTILNPQTNYTITHRKTIRTKYLLYSLLVPDEHIFDSY